MMCHDLSGGTLNQRTIKYSQQNVTLSLNKQSSCCWESWWALWPKTWKWASEV